MYEVGNGYSQHHHHNHGREQEQRHSHHHHHHHEKPSNFDSVVTEAGPLAKNAGNATLSKAAIQYAPSVVAPTTTVAGAAKVVEKVAEVEYEFMCAPVEGVCQILDRPCGQCYLICEGSSVVLSKFTCKYCDLNLIFYLCLLITGCIVFSIGQSKLKGYGEADCLIRKKLGNNTCEVIAGTTKATLYGCTLNAEETTHCFYPIEDRTKVYLTRDLALTEHSKMNKSVWSNSLYTAGMILLVIGGLSSLIYSLWKYRQIQRKAFTGSMNALPVKPKVKASSSTTTGMEAPLLSAVVPLQQPGMLQQQQHSHHRHHSMKDLHGPPELMRSQSSTNNVKAFRKDNDDEFDDY
eukprot:PhF_6_TR9179/c0_g1_i4/m.14315